MLEIGKAYENNKCDVIHIEGKVNTIITFVPCVYDCDGNWYNEQTGAFVEYINERDVNDSRSISDHEPVEVEKKPDPAELREALTFKAKALMNGDNPACLCFGELYDHIAEDINRLAEVSTLPVAYVMACLVDDLMADLD